MASVPSAARLAFLVLGPMLDFKLYLMYTRVFRPRLIWTIILTVVMWLIILQVILSWLVAFNVLNTRSGGMMGFIEGLGRVLEPLYRPFRKILPDFGGLDLSPLVVLILIQIIQGPIFTYIRQVTYAPVA